MLDSLTFWSAVVLDILLGVLGYISSPKHLIYEVLHKISSVSSNLKLEKGSLSKILSKSTLACTILHNIRSLLVYFLPNSFGCNYVTTAIVDDLNSPISSYLISQSEKTHLSLVVPQSSEELAGFFLQDQTSPSGTSILNDRNNGKCAFLSFLGADLKKMYITESTQANFGALVASALSDRACVMPIVYIGNFQLLSAETAELFTTGGCRERLKNKTDNSAKDGATARLLPRMANSPASSSSVSPRSSSSSQDFLTTSQWIQSVCPATVPLVYIPLCSLQLATSNYDVEDSFPLILACEDTMLAYEVASKLGFSPLNVCVVSDVQQLETITALFMGYSFIFGKISQEFNDSYQIKEVLAALFAEWKRVSLCFGVSPVLFRLVAEENSWCSSALYHLCSPFSLFLRGVESSETHQPSEDEVDWIAGDEGRHFLSVLRVIFPKVPKNCVYLSQLEPFFKELS